MKKIKCLHLLVLGLAMLMLGSARANIIIESEDFMIASQTPGIELFMRHKHIAGFKANTPDKILLYVHGATYPSETAFDLPIEGHSMMDLLAEKGYDVYLVDVRGYGKSGRPAEMNQPAANNKPIVDTAQAVVDFSSAVDHVLKLHGVEKINIFGWSWGTSIVGMYTSLNNSKVNRLVMYAPMWIFDQSTALPTGPNAKPASEIGAYRVVSKQSAKDRWLKGLTTEQANGLIPPGVFEAWADSTWKTDPQSNNENLRAPNGVMYDGMTYWQQGKPRYDASKIRVPTFLIHAEWDADLPSYQAHGLFKELKNAPYKRFVELSEGTHTVMLEKNRMQFFREILLFLDEVNPQALTQTNRK